MVPDLPPETPANRLEEALGRMRFRVEPGRWCLLGFPEDPAPEDLAWLVGPARAQLVREGGETTLLVPQEALGELLHRHPGAQVQRDLAWIRFDLPMGWELVGFLARVSSALARAGVPLGAVCGYSRDHLFVAERHLGTARAVLSDLFPEER